VSCADGASDTQGLLHMYLSGTVVGVANAAMFHPVDSIRIRYFFLPRSKKTVHMDDIRGVSFWKGISTPIAALRHDTHRT
jgi:hypothetical protein